MAYRGHQPPKQEGTPILPPDRHGNDDTRAMAAAQLIQAYCKRRHCIDGCVFQTRRESSVGCKLKDYDVLTCPEKWELETTEEE